MRGKHGGLPNTHTLTELACAAALDTSLLRTAPSLLSGCVRVMFCGSFKPWALTCPTPPRRPLPLPLPAPSAPAAPRYTLIANGVNTAATTALQTSSTPFSTFTHYVYVSASFQRCQGPEVGRAWHGRTLRVRTGACQKAPATKERFHRRSRG